LLDEGYIKSYELVEAAPQNNIKVALKYAQGVGHRRTPVIDTIKRISKPGLRIYVTSDEIPMVKRGLGISIVSTSRGLMTGRAAKRLGIGGEVVATIF
jgi:small subunit ribosomal protein S8